MTLAELNALDRASFVAALGAVFEHSPWIADAVYQQRPFASVAALHTAMLDILAATPDRHLALLRAHPELARKTPLTAQSAAEQASMGLDAIAADEAAQFDALNQAYQARFGFPFIIAVRGERDRAAILAAMQKRITRDEPTERTAALAEVARIARSRLDGLITASGRLTTHVLDTQAGTPAAGMAITLYRLRPAREALGEFRTNADGRCDAPLLAADALRGGVYELVFAIAAWRLAQGTPPGFYDEIPIRFRITDPSGHYHVPLILSLHGYTTYRGS